MRVLVAVVCVAATLAPFAPAKAASSAFDTPLSTKKVTLPPANKDGAKTKLTCSYYPHFMVKQVDEGEVGAAQLSIVPVVAGAPKPACQRKNLPSEKVVNPNDWTGYVKGAKGDYVLFDADDGVNGGLGFAVVAAGNAKKLFEDSAVGNLHSLALEGNVLTLRYKRSFAGSCSVPHDGAPCWTKIAAATGQGSAPQPDCAAGYLKAKNEMAKGRCEAQKKSGAACLATALKELDAQRWNEAPSVIVYEVETVLRPGQSSTKPLGGGLSCHPSD